MGTSQILNRLRASRQILGVLHNQNPRNHLFHLLKEFAFASLLGVEVKVQGCLFHGLYCPNPSLSFGTTTLNGISNLGQYCGEYGTTFVECRDALGALDEAALYEHAMRAAGIG